MMPFSVLCASACKFYALSRSTARVARLEVSISVDVYDDVIVVVLVLVFIITCIIITKTIINNDNYYYIIIRKEIEIDV
jgi:hypothetical protein